MNEQQRKMVRDNIELTKEIYRDKDFAEAQAEYIEHLYTSLCLKGISAGYAIQLTVAVMRSGGVNIS